MDIVVDFDGTCVSHAFPEVGVYIGAQRVLKKLVKKGHNLILFTMRCDHPEDFNITGESDVPQVEEGKYLSDAVKWFEDNNIPLYGIQSNPDQITWTTSPKAYGQLHIDDAALGCPLMFNETISHRPYVNWEEVEKILINKKLL